MVPEPNAIRIFFCTTADEILWLGTRGFRLEHFNYDTDA